MTIANNGNVLVGKSAADNTTAGLRISPTGFTAIVTSNDYPLLLNRLSSDGALLTFRKDSTTVGSIGVTGGTGTLYNTGGAGGGIDFSGQTSTTATGASASSGGEVLDHYEEGTWTPTAVGGLTINNVNYARYIKVGGVVNWFFYINATSGTTSACVIGGLPYTSNLSYCMQSNINSSASNPTMTNPHFRLPPNSTNLHALKGNDTVIAGQDLDGLHIIASGTYTAA
jgi:hypothetical protein